MIATNGEKVIHFPSSLLRSLQHLYEQDPIAMEEFAQAISRPRHTQTVSLHFVGGKLTHMEFRTTAKS